MMPALASASDNALKAFRIVSDTDDVNFFPSFRLSADSMLVRK